MSKKTLQYYLPLLSWMGVIFLLSSLEGGGGTGSLSTFQLLLRKGAHVVEYAVLTFLAYHVLIHVHQVVVKQALVRAFALAFVYALSDEIHQLFVIGREGKLLDVGIDCIGIFIALSILIIALRKVQK